MGDVGPNPTNQVTPLASAAGAWTRLSLFHKIITGLGGAITAVGVIFTALYFVINWWTNRFVEPVAKNAAQQEITRLKGEIKSEIITELLEGDKLQAKIKMQANALFESSLKQKIGPMVEGRFTLDSAKSEEKADVYWKEGHSAWLWVYLEELNNGACILIQPPTITTRPKHITKPGLKKSINLAKLLAVQSGSQSVSGQEHDGDTVETNKGIFDNVHQLTFRLGTKDIKDTSGTKCTPELKNASGPVGPVKVEYFIATVPLITVPQIDEGESQ